MAALVAVNAFGSIDDGSSVADIGPPILPDPGGPYAADPPGPGTNTPIGVVVTNARLDKAGCHLAAQSGHDGLARAIQPAHTSADGDALVVAATGAVEWDPAHVRVLTQQAVVAAVRGLR